jgi:hypothetical protein
MSQKSEDKSYKKMKRLWSNLFALTQSDSPLPDNWGELVNQYGDASEEWCVECGKNI